MSHKKVKLVFILVLGLSLLSISAFAQGEGLGERVMIYPWEIWDGEITVSTDDTVVLGARWGACTKGLAQAWTRTSYINYTINGEPLFSSQKESRKFWGRPYPVINTEPDNCVNGSETIWVVAWEYELGLLNEGDYQVHFEMGTAHPFHDGFDSDGDGKPDPQVFDIQFDFAINVIAAGAISGTVTEDGGGPLEGLDVVACRFDTDICLSATTDDGGNYSIYPVPEGDYRVFVYQQDFWLEEFYNDNPIWDWADPVTVLVGQDTPEIDFDLVMGGSISGFVTDEFTGEGIGGLDVIACVFYAEDLCFWGAMTEPDGSYSIRGIPADTYRVFVYQQDYWMEEFYDDKPIWDWANQVTVIAGQDTPEIDFDLVMGGSISGFVTDAETDEGIEGLDVIACVFYAEDLCFWGAMTEADGSYTIFGLPGDFYRVFVYQQGDWMEEFYNDRLFWDEADPVEVSPGDDTGEINFILSKMTIISGQVLNAQDGEGIPGLWVDSCHESVSIDDWGQSTLCNGDDTDENGYYSISILQEGNYRLVIWDPNWIAEFYHDAPNYDLADLVLAIGGQETGGINFELQQAGTISGMVFQSDGITPIPDIGVDVVEGGHGACTDENGYYMIGSLPFGTYDIVAGRDFCGEGGYAETIVEDITVSLETPHVVNLDFNLEQAASLSGMVVDTFGHEIVGIWVGVNDFYTHDWAGGAVTDPEGNYFVSGLAQGDYRICIWNQSWLHQCYNMALPGAETLVALEPGEQRGDINFILTQAGTVSGMVFESDGITPIPNIGVDVVEGGHGACTDETGYYMIGSLPFSTYDIVAGRDFCGEGGFAETIVEDISVSLAAPHVENLDFNLIQAASISGMVVDTFGYEIAGIWVEVNDFYTYNWAGGAHTDTDGYYSVSGLAQGDYRICIWDQSWVHQCYNMALPGAETLVALAPGEHRDDIDFTLTQAGSISGNVIDEYEIPIVGIGVGACQYDEVDPVCYGNSTDNQGNFTLSGMIPDEYLVFIWDQEGWANQLFYQTQDFDLATPVLVVAGQDTGGIAFTLTPAVP